MIVELAVQIAIVAVPFSTIMDDPAFPDLLRAYATECLVPDVEPQPAIYAGMDKAGMLRCFAAYAQSDSSDSLLIGFCSVITAVVPHDGHLVATTESLFVDPVYRHTEAFELLFSAAEQYATEARCRVLTCGARIGSALDKVLSRRAGFTATHTQHTKWLGGFKPRFIEPEGKKP